MTIPILIPAYNPNRLLVDLINKLLELGADNIIVIDDGSNQNSKDVFDQIQKINNCHKCTHAINLGKGRAIKTGLNFVLHNYPELTGVVTADADGQHSPEDIIKVQQKLRENPKNLVMGCRIFDNQTPFRSKLGNEITKKVFHLLTGIKLSDTQSGLRGIPLKFIPECLRMDGERYDYEINMLVSSGKHEIKLKEVPIQTIYLEGNRSSHFNPILDSIKIYFVLFRFLLSSLTTTLLDFIVFIICSGLGMSILSSTIISRVVAGNYNFLVNKKIVFKSQSNFTWSFIKYWSLVFLLGSLSYIIITFLVRNKGLNLLLSKASIETLLFFVSFTLQRNLIFNSSEK